MFQQFLRIAEDLPVTGGTGAGEDADRGTVRTTRFQDGLFGHRTVAIATQDRHGTSNRQRRTDDVDAVYRVVGRIGTFVLAPSEART